MHAIGVKLCPAPTHFTRLPAAAAPCTIATSSASLVGRRTSAGAQLWFPAQFVHDGAALHAHGRNLAVGLPPPRTRLPERSRAVDAGASE